MNRNKCIGIDGSHHSGSNEQVYPSSSSIGKPLGISDDMPLRGRSSTVFVESLLEDVLSSATSRSTLWGSSESHPLSRCTGNNGNSSSMRFSKEGLDDKYDLTRNKCDLNDLHCKSSSSETDSNISDFENTAALLISPLDEPDAETDRDVLLRTKNEQDESKIYIPRPDFVITGEHTLVKVGTISAVLDDAVVVTTFNLSQTPRQLSDADISNATALDTGSLLCFSDGTILGAVFETFGPVSSPLYVIRFNNSDEIPTAARVGVEVKYVEQEMRLVRGCDVRAKGYDASGKDDEETHAEDFSDDEMERRAKKKRRSGTADRRCGPQKRARGYCEPYGEGGSDRGVKQKGLHNERERYQRHKVERRWPTAPAERPRHSNFRGYNAGPYLNYTGGVSSQPLPQTLMPGMRFPNGTFSNSMPSGVTMPGFYASAVPLSMPAPLITSPQGPGEALNAIIPGAQLGRQLPSSVLPQAVPPYGASSAISMQPQFACLDQTFSAPTNSHITQQNTHHASVYQEYNVTQTRAGQVPRTGPSQHHRFPNPYVQNSEEK